MMTVETVDPLEIYEDRGARMPCGHPRGCVVSASSAPDVMTTSHCGWCAAEARAIAAEKQLAEAQDCIKELKKCTEAEKERYRTERKGHTALLREHYHVNQQLAEQRAAMLAKTGSLADECYDLREMLHEMTVMRDTGLRQRDEALDRIGKLETRIHTYSEAAHTQTLELDVTRKKREGLQVERDDLRRRLEETQKEYACERLAHDGRIVTAKRLQGRLEEVQEALTEERDLLIDRAPGLAIRMDRIIAVLRGEEEVK